MIQNTERVRIDFLFWNFTWPLWLLTLVTAVVGALVWIGVRDWTRSARKARRADRRDEPPGTRALLDTAEPSRSHP